MPLAPLYLIGAHSSTCGYCSEVPGKRSDYDSSYSYGVQPHPGYGGKPFPSSIYMDMLDRGWRRSGWYIYKPDMQQTCCPQYTIRLDAMEFNPTRSQRQTTYRWNRFIMEGEKHDGKLMDVDSKNDSRPRQNHGKSTPPFDLVTSVHSCEYSFIEENSPSPAHRFEVNLEPASFTEEKFELYQRYQRDIHKEQDIKRRSSFEGFLVESPLSASIYQKDSIAYTNPPPVHLPTHYGSYHQCYRIDGELIAVGVLDILPRCVSSVYFMYDKKWERFSLGKVGALRETALAREMCEAGATEVRYLYMGFYIHSCSKMRYKGEYSPSYLLDPEEYTWFPLKDCTSILSKYRYGCFANPEHSRADPKEEPDNDEDVSSHDMTDIMILDTSQMALVPIPLSPYWLNKDDRNIISTGVRGLGLKTARKLALILAT